MKEVATIPERDTPRAGYKIETDAMIELVDTSVL